MESIIIFYILVQVCYSFICSYIGGTELEGDNEEMQNPDHFLLLKA